MIDIMKKLLTVAAVALMASGAAFAGTLAYGFINDDGATVTGPNGPSTGTATFIRVQNFGSSTVDMTAVMADNTGTAFHSNTGSLTAGNFFSWRPRNFQGIAPSGSGASANGSMTVFHTGSPGVLGGNVVVISSNGSRLAFLALEQI